MRIAIKDIIQPFSHPFPVGVQMRRSLGEGVKEGLREIFFFHWLSQNTGPT